MKTPYKAIGALALPLLFGGCEPVEEGRSIRGEVVSERYVPGSGWGSSKYTISLDTRDHGRKIIRIVDTYSQQTKEGVDEMIDVGSLIDIVVKVRGKDKTRENIETPILRAYADQVWLAED